MDAESRRQRDEEVVRHFLAGEEQAFDEIVETYKDNIHQFVRSFMDCEGNSEDIAQEVFIQAYKSLHSFRGRSLLSTWLYSIARNVCLHHLRARYANKRIFQAAESTQWLEIPDWRPNQEVLLQNEETRAVLHAEVEALPSHYRVVIVLSHWEDLPYKEISRILEIPIGTVKSRVHNAVVMLSERLRPLLERSEDCSL